MSNDKNERLAKLITEIGEIYARHGFVIQPALVGVETALGIIDISEESPANRKRCVENGVVDLYCPINWDMICFYDLGGRFPGDECY